jgi:V/A-type H+-transporting ATPase subunit C
MSRTSRLNYAYAVGRVHALEKYLVEQAVFREAADATDFLAALKIIYDAGNYPEDLIKLKNSEEFDAFIRQEEEKLGRLLTEILLEKDIREVFLLKEYPEVALGLARKSGYPFIRDYIRHIIDLGNLKILGRAKYLGLSQDHFERRLLKGGWLEERFLRECYPLSFGEVGEKLRTSFYGDVWERGTDILENRETFIGLEKGIEDFLMGYLRGAKKFTFGPEPVFAYGEAKRKEFALIRLLAVGKMNLVPPEWLKERIGETYV